MRLFLAVSIGCAGLLAGSAALAAPDKESDGQKLICKVEQPATGSRLGAKKVCGTAEEWAERERIAAEVRKNVDRMQQQRGTSCPPTC